MKTTQKAYDVLSALLRNWAEAIRNPGTARAVLCPRLAFNDPFLVALLRELLLANGDWRRAVEGLRQSHQDAGRILAFIKWAEEITARPVRGLLPWKGGAA